MESSSKCLLHATRRTRSLHGVLCSMNAKANSFRTKDLDQDLSSLCGVCLLAGHKIENHIAGDWSRFELWKQKQICCLSYRVAFSAGRQGSFVNYHLASQKLFSWAPTSVCNDMYSIYIYATNRKFRPMQFILLRILEINSFVSQPRN